MLKTYKKILLLIILFTLILSSKVFAATNIETYTIKTEENNVSTEKLINNTMQYSKPSPVYDFFDEDGKLNVIYTSEENVYWAKFDNKLNVTSTIKMKQFYDKSNSKDFMLDLIYNFGNALYYNGNLYVVYGREANTSSSTVVADKYPTMALVKYDKQGKIVGQLELASAENNHSTDWSYGTYLPFYPNCNCSLAVNDGIIACFFGKQMFNNHQSSSIFFVDADTMEWVSNIYYASEEDKAKYKNVVNYYNSHSMAERIIPTSDGGFLLVDSSDGTYRGLLVTKIYKDANGNFQRKTSKMIHYREGGPDTHGYNNTYSLVGNVIELSDGYMYVGALEKTLSMSYGNKVNESWNIMVQKYSKDFYTRDIEEGQLLDGEVREAVGPASEYNGIRKTISNRNRERLWNKVAY